MMHGTMSLKNVANCLKISLLFQQILLFIHHIGCSFTKRRNTQQASEGKKKIFATTG